MTAPPALLTARLVGSRFPSAPWEGRVVGIYDRAINIGHPSGLVLSIVADKESMTALSVWVALPAGIASFEALSPFDASTPWRSSEARAAAADPGTPAAGDESGLHVGRLAIDLLAARLWSGSPSPRMLGARGLKRRQASTTHPLTPRGVGRSQRALRRAPAGAVTGAGDAIANGALLLGDALARIAQPEGLASLVSDPRGSNRFAARCAEALAALAFRRAPIRACGRRHAYRVRAARQTASYSRIGFSAGSRAALLIGHDDTCRRRPGTARRKPRCKLPLVVQGLSRIVGLGIGLTPSGDDFIAGALLGEWLVRFAGGVAPTIRIDRAEIEASIARTTPAGRTLLWLATRGSFPAYLVEIARELVGARKPEAVASAVERAAAHGETSGGDAATGLWWYLSLRTSVLDLFPLVGKVVHVLNGGFLDRRSRASSPSPATYSTSRAWSTA